VENVGRCKNNGKIRISWKRNNFPLSEYVSYLLSVLIRPILWGVFGPTLFPEISRFWNVPRSFIIFHSSHFSLEFDSHHFDKNLLEVGKPEMDLIFPLIVRLRGITIIGRIFYEFECISQHQTKFFLERAIYYNKQRTTIV